MKENSNLFLGTENLHGMPKEPDILMMMPKGGTSIMPSQENLYGFAARPLTGIRSSEFVEKYRKIFVSEYGDIEPGLTVDIYSGGTSGEIALHTGRFEDDKYHTFYSSTRSYRDEQKTSGTCGNFHNLARYT